MSLFQNRSFSITMWQLTNHVSAFQELASRSRRGRIGADIIQPRVSARRRQTADGMPGRFSGRNLPLSGQWTMPPTHAIDARHTLEKLQQTRSSVSFQLGNVAVVHRAHRALEKAEIASRTLDGALLLVVNFARASSWSVKIAAEQVLPEN